MVKKISFISLLVIFVTGYIANFSLVETIKLRTFDALVEEQDPSNYFTILDITTDDIQQAGGWPFPRQVLAEIQSKIMGNGALGVGWVVNFSNPDRFGGDEMFAEFVADLPTVVATFSMDNDLKPPSVGTVILGVPDLVHGIEVPGYLPNIDLIKDAALEGLVSAPTEVDNLVRRMPLLYKTDGGYTPAFGTQVLKRLAEADTYIIKQNEFGIEEITVEGIPPIPTDDLGRVWISWVDTPKTTLKEMHVAGKFVFIGTSAAGILPQIAVPGGYKYPHHIQAALSESILIQNSPYIPDYAVAVELLILLLSMVLIWSVLNKFNLGIGLLSFFIVVALTGSAGLYLIKSGLLIDVTWAIIASVFTGSTAFYLNYREQYKLRQLIKKQFEHYLDPRQIAILQKSPGKLVLGGEKRYATFIFTDLRNFTAMSEKLKPEQVTYIMNRVLTAQTKALLKHGFMIDKFIGDACMGIGNAPLDLEDHETKALLCALDMLANMAQLNEDLKKEGIDPVKIGIGINSGEAIIGNMGSETRFDYTAIGDAVNTAARLESATKEAGADILIGKNTESQIEFNLTPLDPIKVKGKSEPLQVFTWDTSSL